MALNRPVETSHPRGFDGTPSTGRAAAVRVLSRLPLTAWFALPFLLLPASRPVPVRTG